MEPVALPRTDLHDDGRARLAQTRDALKEANSRLVKSRQWYDGVRGKYAGEGR